VPYLGERATRATLARIVYGAPMRTLGTLLLALILASALAQVDLGRGYYLGRIGDGTLEMELTIEGNGLSGWVRRAGVERPIEVEGTVTEGDRGPAVRFSAADDGSGYGTFDGVITLSEDDRRFGIVGRWIGPDGASLPFETARVAEYGALDLRQGRIDARRSLPFFIDPALSALNPPLHDAALTELTEFFEEGREMLVAGDLYFGWSSDEATAIRYLGDGFLSAFSRIHSYTGGAHGNTFYRVFNLRIVDGVATPLALGDLFRPDSGYLAPLSDYVMAELERQGAEDVVSGALVTLDEEDLATFTLAPDGLTFAFAPYRVGYYAQGSFFVTVPLEVVAPYANGEGPLKELMHQR
jgi:hypothetical protein